jgi:hypothetical protein
MATHSAEARKLRRELDKQLGAAARQAGRPLRWSPSELQVLDLITDAIDRKLDLQKDYTAAEDSKTRVQISTEVRLLEAHIERMLRRVKVEIPQPVSRRSQKAAEAARIRWSRDAG